MKHQISTLLLLAAILAACAESVPHKVSNKTSHDNMTQESVAMPILVSSAEADLARLGGQSIDNGSAAIVVTDSPVFDSVAVKANANIRSRALTISAPIAAMPNLTRWIGYVAGQVGSYTGFTYDTAGARTKRTRYSAAGADGAWFTADDVVAGYALFDVTRGTTIASSIAFGSAGPDGIWFNDDDVINHYSKELADPIGSALTYVTVLRPGLDAQWFTTDDVIRWGSTSGVNAQGNQEWTQYRGPGTDLDWATQSDNLVGHFEIESATAGIVDRHTFYTSTGIDKTQYTADDVVGFYHQYIRDAQQQLQQTMFYAGGPGADATWFTPDDIVNRCRTLDRDAAGNSTRYNNYSPGSDGVCFTADDVMTGYRDRSFNAAGVLTNSKEYSATGPDGAWFTADDVLYEESQYMP